MTKGNVGGESTRKGANCGETSVGEEAQYGCRRDGLSYPAMDTACIGQMISTSATDMDANT